MKEHQAAPSIYRALVCVADGDVSAFWSFLPSDQRTEAITVINGAATKLAALSADGQLARIMRTAPGRRS